MVDYETPIKPLWSLLILITFLLISFLTCIVIAEVILCGHFRWPHSYEHRCQAHSVNEEVAEHYFEAIKL